MGLLKPTTGTGGGEGLSPTYKALLDGATDAATASTLVKRDADGNASFAAVTVGGNDIAHALAQTAADFNTLSLSFDSVYETVEGLSDSVFNVGESVTGLATSFTTLVLNVTDLNVSGSVTGLSASDVGAYSTSQVDTLVAPLTTATSAATGGTLVLRATSPAYTNFGNVQVFNLTAAAITATTLNNIESLNLTANVDNVLNVTYASDEGSGTIATFYDGTTDTDTHLITKDGMTLTGTMTANLFSGSGASLTNLNASNIASGTLNVARLPTAIPATSIGGGLVDNTEFAYLNGVTSNIQTQLNGKYGGSTIFMDGGGLIDTDGGTISTSDLTAYNVAAELMTLSGGDALMSITASDNATGSAGMVITAPDSTYVGSLPTITSKNGSVTTFSVSNTGNVTASGSVTAATFSGSEWSISHNGTTLNLANTDATPNSDADLLKFTGTSYNGSTAQTIAYTKAGRIVVTGGWGLRFTVDGTTVAGLRNTGYAVSSGCQYYFSHNGNPNDGAADTGLTRPSANVVKITNGSTGAGVLQLGAYGSTPTNAAASADGNIYVKGGKLVVQYNDAGTVRYKYLDLTGTGVTWTHTTTAP